jgi:serine protease Do
VIVTRVTDGSPAAAARLQVGDLILRMDGRVVTSTREMTRMISEKAIGRPVTVTLVRDGRQRDVQVTLDELPDDAPPARSAPEETTGMSNDLGADLVALDDDIRRRFGAPSDMNGVAVTAVSARGRAYNKLRRGDIIVEVNFQSVASVQDVLARVRTAMQTPAQPILMRVKRRGETGGWFDQFVSVEIRR